MGNTVYFASLEGADMTMEAGAWDGRDSRNDGPALWLDDGSGGVIAECADRATMIRVLTELLERAKTMPEPVPDAACKHCRRAIRYVPYWSGDYAWLHRGEWVDACFDEHGNVLRAPRTPGFPQGRELTAWPATTDATPKVGDQVIDTTDLDDPEDEHLTAEVGIVWEIWSGLYTLDNDHMRTPDVLRVVAAYKEEEDQS
jgi:hypothetical protein